MNISVDSHGTKNFQQDNLKMSMAGRNFRKAQLEDAFLFSGFYDRFAESGRDEQAQEPLLCRFEAGRVD